MISVVKGVCPMLPNAENTYFLHCLKTTYSALIYHFMVWCVKPQLFCLPAQKVKSTFFNFYCFDRLSYCFYKPFQLFI